ncbi:unnamed protein product, partial [Sphenostylis stenocarpa]
MCFMVAGCELGHVQMRRLRTGSGAGDSLHRGSAAIQVRLVAHRGGCWCLAFSDSHYALTKLAHSFLDLPRALLNLPNLSSELTHHRIVQICRQHRERGSIVNNHAVIPSAVHARQHIQCQDSRLPYGYPSESNAVEIRMLRVPKHGFLW